YHMRLSRRTVLSPENLPDEALEALRDRIRRPLRVAVDPPDGLAEAPQAGARALPEAVLLPPRPNPVAGRAEVPFSVAMAGPVRLALYDALGREVQVLAEGDFSAGEHRVVLEATALPAGVYHLRL